MGEVIEGTLNANALRFGIVVARFNNFITDSLLEGCLDALARHGTDPQSIDVVKVPGSFEIPVVAKRLAQSGRYDAIICLGAIIRGSTTHYDHVCSACTSGVAAVSLETGIPTIFGVITTDSIEQAIERAGTKAGNKGWDAATAAIEMANVMKKLP